MTVEKAYDTAMSAGYVSINIRFTSGTHVQGSYQKSYIVASYTATGDILSIEPISPQVKLDQDLKAQADAEFAAGIFHDGTYDIGTAVGQLAPGKYRVQDVKDCYWERTKQDGEILDNQFATRAQAITVTIRKTDGSFTSTGCGEWKRV